MQTCARRSSTCLRVANDDAVDRRQCKHHSVGQPTGWVVQAVWLAQSKEQRTEAHSHYGLHMCITQIGRCCMLLCKTALRFWFQSLPPCNTCMQRPGLDIPSITVIAAAPSQAARSRLTSCAMYSTSSIHTRAPDHWANGTAAKPRRPAYTHGQCALVEHPSPAGRSRLATPASTLQHGRPKPLHASCRDLIPDLAWDSA